MTATLHARMASCRTWNKEMSREFSLYKPIMWPLGSWPLDSDRNFAKLRALFLTVTQTIMVVYISMDIGYQNGATLPMVINRLMIASCGILTTIKIILIWLHRDDLLQNLCNAASDWTYITKQDYRQVMFRYTNLGRFVFYFQMGFLYFITAPLIVGPLLSYATLLSSPNVTLTAESEMRAMKLPHEMICPFDSYIICFGLYILQTVQLIGTTLGNSGSDVFFFAVCMHLCGQLEILGLELSRFHEGKKNDCWKRHKMITLIERHCLLLNLAKHIVNTLDIMLIAQMILHAFLICLIGLQLIVTLANQEFFFVTRSIGAFNVLILQLFLYSYIGETLSSKTQAISHAIYLSKWYDLPRNIMRDVYFIITRANMSVRIRVGKFYIVDLSSFTTILKISVSYFSVLQIIFA